MIEIVIAAILVTPVLAPALVWMLLPENRRRREAKTAYRTMERLERRPHVHEWGRWTEPEERRIYAQGVTAKEVENRLPVRRDYYQHRTCDTCGEVEQRVF